MASLSVIKLNSFMTLSTGYKTVHVLESICTHTSAKLVSKQTYLNCSIEYRQVFIQNLELLEPLCSKLVGLSLSVTYSLVN